MIRYKLKFWPLILGVLGSASALTGQDFDGLVRKAWDKSPFLKEKQILLEQAEAGLREARAFYMPSVGWAATYTLAAGGRSIEFPVGDLLNPVYAALDQLTGTPQFPRLENVQTYFLPNNFYDTRFRVQQPIYQPDISIQTSIKKEELQQRDLDIRMFKRTLSREVIQTRLQLESARVYRDILLRAVQYLATARRQSESLLRNGMVLPSVLQRLDSESAHLKARLSESDMLQAQAEAYLFYLTGEKDFPPILLAELPEIPGGNPFQREELLQLESGIRMQEKALKREQQFYHPRIGLMADLGSQDFQFNWNPYVLVGLNLEWNLYDGGRLKQRKIKAKKAVQSISTHKTAVEEQIALQSQIARIQLEGSIAQAKTHAPRIQSADRVYQETLKTYQEGTSGYLELIDAQNLWLNAQSEYRLARFTAWQKWSEYLFVKALYPIE